MTRPRNGAELLCAELDAAGVRCVFGLPGTQSVHLYEALRRSGLRSIGATHELAASFMANGHHRASGHLAALFTIPGPGLTYALTGLAEARDDSAAVLHVVPGPVAEGRPFGFQALDPATVAAPLVKGVVMAERAGDLPARVRAALALARLGEPGPVLLQCSREALAGAVPPLSAPLPAAEARRADPARLARMAVLVTAARRPVLLLGQGCASSSSRAIRLAEALVAPVLTTGSGRGTVPEDHPLALAFDYPRGAVARLNAMLGTADCILAMGCKLSSAGTGIFALDLPADRLVHVDASEEVAGRSYPALLSVVATADEALDALEEALARRGPAPASTWTAAEIGQGRATLRSGAGERTPEPTFQGVSPGTAAAFFGALRRALPRQGIVVTDSGLHQTMVRRHLDVLGPRGLIMPSDFQSMGYAIPAAIGARLAAPERPVVAVVGDGGFAMSGMELVTAVRERIPLTVVVLVDGYLGLIRLAQLDGFGRGATTTLLNPDFAAFAAAVGARHALVDGNAEEVLRAAVASDGVTLVEVRLGDSPAIRGLQARGLARSAVRRSLGPRVVAWLRRLQRRLASRS